MTHYITTRDIQHQNRQVDQEENQRMEQVREMSIAIATIFSVKVPVETTKNFRKMKQKRSQHDQRIGKRQQHFFSLDALTNPKRHLISKNFFLSTFCQMTLLPSFQQSLRIITLPRKQ